ncbi:glycoside hydrolase family 19 protein [Conchiformibius steedae]|uniref:glycoside hydrolase family 19 protein n=1 Tax=Conchiformibius steedae TaxID=153493 RepID=UPI0026F10AE4|nr:glycoside hydrolase family 19 protein [Conchiformibius steedae]
MNENRAAFYDKVRHSLFSGSLTQKQVDGMEALLTAISPFSVCEQAYMLATAYHETARTMQPIAEIGKGSGRTYGTWRTNSLGVCYCYADDTRKVVYAENDYPHLYYGRGYVQLTWLKNYKRAGKELGAALDDADQLARDPKLAMRPDIAAMIMCFGMKDGWFTGRKLSDYIRGDQADYVNARRIINGMDKAQTIATYARKFESALRTMS